jgi:hypothetical protein
MLVDRQRRFDVAMSQNLRHNFNGILFEQLGRERVTKCLGEQQPEFLKGQKEWTVFVVPNKDGTFFVRPQEGSNSDACKRGLSLTKLKRIRVRGRHFAIAD